jgi:hypothetical protein
MSLMKFDATHARLVYHSSTFIRWIFSNHFSEIDISRSNSLFSWVNDTIETTRHARENHQVLHLRRSFRITKHEICWSRDVSQFHADTNHRRNSTFKERKKRSRATIDHQRYSHSSFNRIRSNHVAKRQFTRRLQFCFRDVFTMRWIHLHRQKNSRFWFRRLTRHTQKRATAKRSSDSLSFELEDELVSSKNNIDRRRDQWRRLRDRFNATFSRALSQRFKNISVQIWHSLIHMRCRHIHTAIESRATRIRRQLFRSLISTKNDDQRSSDWFHRLRNSVVETMKIERLFFIHSNSFDLYLTNVATLSAIEQSLTSRDRRFSRCNDLDSIRIFKSTLIESENSNLFRTKKIFSKNVELEMLSVKTRRSRFHA